MIRGLFHRLKRTSTEQTFKPVILVTGCSTGIGRALAELLYVSENYRVVATARPNSFQRLQERFTESDRFIIRPLDVISELNRIQVMDEIAEKWGGVNIL